MIREDMYEVYEHVFFQVKDLVTALYSARSLLTNPFVRRGDDHRRVLEKFILAPCMLISNFCLKGENNVLK